MSEGPVWRGVIGWPAGVVAVTTPLAPVNTTEKKYRCDHLCGRLVLFWVLYPGLTSRPCIRQPNIGTDHVLPPSRTTFSTTQIASRPPIRGRLSQHFAASPITTYHITKKSQSPQIVLRGLARTSQSCRQLRDRARGGKRPKASHQGPPLGREEVSSAE